MKRYKQDVLWPMFSISRMYASSPGFEVVARVSKEYWSALCPCGREIKGQSFGEYFYGNV